MAHLRDSVRTYGRSDPIDALAVVRAALREPGRPTAPLDGPEREVRLLVDHLEAGAPDAREPLSEEGAQEFWLLVG